MANCQAVYPAVLALGPKRAKCARKANQASASLPHHPRGSSNSRSFGFSLSVAKEAQRARPVTNAILNIETVPSESVEDYKAELAKCREALVDLVKTANCAPILVRLAWHDSGTYNKNIAEWPARGGADGSIRFKPEIDHGANAGLVIALNLLKKIKTSFPKVTYADLFQLASATAIEVAGGPNIPMRYGRQDVEKAEDCPPEGNLPGAEEPFPDQAPTPAQHLKNIFYRMGLDDKDIVALSGAHTIGRARKDRSGVSMCKDATKYTENGPGLKGGSSWTVEWLKFDNSYFTDVKNPTDPELMVLPTDACLFEDEGFKPYAEKYLVDQEAFFNDYAESHAKLADLGSKFVPEEGIRMD